MRRRTQRRLVLTSVLVVIAGAVGGWLLYFDRAAPLNEANASTGDGAGAIAGPEAVDPEAMFVTAPEDASWERTPPASALASGEESAEEQPAAATPRPDEEVLLPIGGPASAAAPAVVTANDDPAERFSAEPAGGAEPGADDDANIPLATNNPAITAAQQQYEQGKPIEARHALNALLRRDLPDRDAVAVRALLTRIADDTIFSRRRLNNDPLVAFYRIEPGDALARIGPRFDVPYEIIMKVNDIRDATKIRADQEIKVPRGPFHARIDKSEFRLDIYLQDLYVRSYRVGLGADQGTPTGAWRVKERLPNPTYYPPASAPDKRVIPADDPSNPLGEHWIGLEGTEGDAVGRTGFGIHGTIEPESIGKAVSLGCVRMHNEDVEFLYSLLQPGRSTITVVP